MSGCLPWLIVGDQVVFLYQHLEPCHITSLATIEVPLMTMTIEVAVQNNPAIYQAVLVGVRYCPFMASDSHLYPHLVCVEIIIVDVDDSSPPFFCFSSFFQLPYT